MAIASAATTNVRRIHRFLVAKTKRENEQKQASQDQECTQDRSNVSFSASLKAFWNGFTTPFSLQLLCLLC
jgi:hypothetical protein